MKKRNLLFLLFIFSSICAFSQNESYVFGSNYYQDDFFGDSDLGIYDTWCTQVNQYGFSLHIFFNQNHFADNIPMDFSQIDGFSPIDISKYPFIKVKVMMDSAWYDPGTGVEECQSGVRLGMRIFDDSGEEISSSTGVTLDADGQWNEITFDYSNFDRAGDSTRFSKIIFTPIYQHQANWTNYPLKNFPVWIDYLFIGDTLFDDPTLDSLSVEGNTIEPAFDPITGSYTVALDAGTTEAPTINYHLLDPEATVVYTSPLDITSAVNADRTATIAVTSQNGEYSKSYSILFNGAVANDVAEFESEILVYPNPANDILYFENVAQICSISIIDMTGKALLKQSFTGDETEQLNIENLSQGLYFINLYKINEVKLTRKIIKR